MNLGIENYIIRIYRRDGKNDDDIVGIVETVGIDDKKPFRNTEELLSILQNGKRKDQTREKR